MHVHILDKATRWTFRAKCLKIVWALDDGRELALLGAVAYRGPPPKRQSAQSVRSNSTLYRLELFSGVWPTASGDGNNLRLLEPSRLIRQRALLR
jgi:hypothetical protein